MTQRRPGVPAGGDLAWCVHTRLHPDSVEASLLLQAHSAEETYAAQSPAPQPGRLAVCNVGSIAPATLCSCNVRKRDRAQSRPPGLSANGKPKNQAPVLSPANFYRIYLPRLTA